MTTGPAVGFLGLGKMGLPMSRHLAAGGFSVQAWNRSPRVVEPPSAGSLTLVATPAEAAAGADVVITMLPDIAEVAAVCAGPDGVAAGAAPGTVIVVMGTVSQVALRSWAETVAASGLSVVDAPVSGGELGAIEGRLSVMVGGSPEDVARVRPVFETMAADVRHLGPLGSGQLAKACNQIIVATTLAALAEAVTLGRHGGLDIGELLDVLASGLAGSRALEFKRDLLVSRRVSNAHGQVRAAKGAGPVYEELRGSPWGAVRRSSPN